MASSVPMLTLRCVGTVTLCRVPPGVSAATVIPASPPELLKTDRVVPVSIFLRAAPTLAGRWR